jgi:hypothetical protein
MSFVEVGPVSADGDLIYIDISARITRG